MPAEADLVCYWFEKSRALIEAGKLSRAGLVATNSIRGGANRKVLDRISETGRIFEAWSDEPWVLDGAAVRVSLVCFDAKHDSLIGPVSLNGVKVKSIFPDLTSSSADLTKAKRLKENFGRSFMGDTKGGAFDIDGGLARQWLQLPLNPNRRPNSDVLRPWVNGLDITRRPQGKWIIDFGWELSEDDASQYEAPFEFCRDNVKPVRDENRRDSYREFWWCHVEPRPGMWAALSKLSRFIVTPTVAKHRLFAWLPAKICPDHQLIAIARDDDTTFGVLHSRFHELWTLRLCTWLGVGNDPRYTPSTTFEMFPLPEGLTPNIPAEKYASDPRAKRIAEAAKRLNELRENWLNPEDLVKREPEVVSGYPERILPRNEKAAAILKKRTLTNLYNERPTWLANAHRELDEAVAAAYGWPADLSDDEVLARLFALNQVRTGVASAKASSSEVAGVAEPPKRAKAKRA